MQNRIARAVVLCAALGAIAASATAVTVTMARASTNPNCPALSATGVVTPAPAPGDDWSTCYLWQANLSGANFTNVNLSGANIASANLANATFDGTNLTGAFMNNDVLSGAAITDSVLVNTVLQGADLTNLSIADSDLTGANILLTSTAGIKLRGIRSGELSVQNTISLPSDWAVVNSYLVGPTANFSGDVFSALTARPELDHANLAGANFDAVDATGWDLDTTNFSKAQFAAANLTNTNLQWDIFTGANLQGANLTGAELSGASSGQITGTPTALPADWALRAGYLLGPQANLNNTNLDGADLSGLDLESAQLEYASLKNANLTGADLAGALLGGTDLAGVKWSNTTCPNGTNSNDDGGTCVIAATAAPTISGTAKNGWYRKVTVTWHWSDAVEPIDTKRCPATTTSTVQGKPTHITATCYTIQDIAAKASVAVNIENTGPKVAVTGVAAGHVYAVGHVPAAGCRTTDVLSGVAKAAKASKVSVTTPGANGTGTFTVTCAGAVAVAGIAQAAPVKATYTVAYGLSAYLAPKNKAAVARSTNPFRVTFKLAGIGASQAAKLAAAGRVRVTLSGPGISPVTVTATWHASTGTFTAVVSVPAKAKTGVSYALAVRENLGAGLVTAPPAGKAPNPESISFR